MWDRYQPPGDDPAPDGPEKPEQWPVLPARESDAGGGSRSPYRPQPSARRGVTSRGKHASPAVAAFGIVGVVVFAVAVGGGLSDSGFVEEPSDAGWYDCIESYADDEPGILTPADLCEIGHDRPADYTGFDDYDFDPLGPEYDSWREWEDDGSLLEDTGLDGYGG
jgi:hypothetical protein